MAEIEPKLASDYDDRTTAAVRSVLVEIGQILGGYRGKFAVIGGAVPWLLLNQSEMPHVGTMDVDIGLDAESLGDGEYARLVESLLVITDFAVQGADGADLALRFYQLVAIDGEMPGGGVNNVRIAVASIPALLAMKGYAIANRLKQKDAYDIYHSIRNFPGGIGLLAEATRPLLEVETARIGYLHISQKFRTPEDFGPMSVKRFVDRPEMLAGRTAEQWQQDVFGQVQAWLSALGLT